MLLNKPIVVTVLIPLLFVFMWSTGFIGAKYGLPAAEPLTFLWVRHAITVGILFCAIAFWKIRLPNQPIAYVHLVVAGILIHGIYLGGVFSAIYRGVDAGLSAVIVGLQPLLTVLLSAIWLRESIGKRKSIGMLAGFAGIVIVIGQRGIGINGISAIGLWFCIAALIGISAGTSYQKKFCADFDLLPAIFIQYIGSLTFLLILAQIFESGEIDWNNRFIFAMAWLVIVLSLGAVVLLMWLIRNGEAGKTASLFYLVPAFTSVEAWLLFGEQLSLIAIFGIALCVGGVALVMKAPDTLKP